MKVDPEDVIVEFQHPEPLPPGLTVIVGNTGLVTKIGSNQADIGGGFTIRCRYHRIIANEVSRMDKQTREMLSSLGLTKQEVDIIVAAISGVKIAPLAYSSINDMTQEITEAKALRERVAAFTGELLVVKEKKPRAPRSDKGKKKAPATPPIPPLGREVSDGPKDDDDDQGKTDPPVPTPRKRDKAAPSKKETDKEIKDNVASLTPAVDL